MASDLERIYGYTRPHIVDEEANYLPKSHQTITSSTTTHGGQTGAFNDVDADEEADGDDDDMPNLV